MTERFELVTRIHAPREVCFDLSRSVDLHVRSFGESGEHVVAGRTSGLVGMGEEVTWRARHFGLWHEHAARITAYDRPAHFRDTMIAGRFRSFAHDHFFAADGEVTVLRDVIEFASPFGFVGRVFDRCVLRGYLRRLIGARNDVLRREAEAIPRAPADRVPHG